MFKRINFFPLFHPSTKINSKWTRHLNLRAKTVNFLEENTGVNLDDLWLGNSFLDKDTQIIRETRKIHKLDVTKIETFVFQRHKKMKR